MSARSLWERVVLPYAVEACCAASSIERQRLKLIHRARGRVLDLGVGSGLNFAHYGDRVSGVVGVDPCPELLRRARARAQGAGYPVELIEGLAERLELEDDSFDTVVCTYTLCSVEDLSGAIGELRRVLRPGGALLISEHGLSPEPSVRRWQRRLEPLWSRLGGGCRLSRDVAAALAQAGFETTALESMYLPGPRWLNFHTWGLAERLGSGEISDPS